MPFNPMYASGVMKQHSKLQPDLDQQVDQVNSSSRSIHQPQSKSGWDSNYKHSGLKESNTKDKMMAMAKEQTLHKQTKASTHNKSFQEKLKFAITFSLSLIAIGGLSALMFLVPFVVDPALATLTAGFSRKSVECRVIKTQPIVGASNCLWSSCREGCTRDIFRCHHIHVEYSMRQEDYSFIKAESEAKGSQPPTFIQSAALLVNVRGCGYPPVVQCEEWITKFGINNSVFPCHYATTNHSLAVTSLDEDGELSNLLLATLLPLCACIISSISLCLMHTQCIRIFKTPRIYHINDMYESKTEDGASEKYSHNTHFLLETNQRSSKKTMNNEYILPSSDTEDIRFEDKRGKTNKHLTFQSAKGSLKRKADFFELPTFTKKVKISTVRDTSSTENLLPLQLSEKIILNETIEHSAVNENKKMYNNY